MRICYHCERCGTDIAALEVASIDEHKLGFDCLTRDEREDIISMDMNADTMHVKSLCDQCAAEPGDALHEEGLFYAQNTGIAAYRIH